MTLNRRRPSKRQSRASGARAAFYMMLYTSKLQIVVPGLALAGILFVVAIQIAPHHWQGRCYQTIIESSSARRGPAQQLVCLKHIPFADAAMPAQ